MIIEDKECLSFLQGKTILQAEFVVDEMNTSYYVIRFTDGSQINICQHLTSEISCLYDSGDYPETDLEDYDFD